MVKYKTLACQHYIDNIAARGFTIYDAIDMNDPRYWIPSQELEQLLNEKLLGVSLDGLPLRTRSKVLKQKICSALGYIVPTNFIKTHPRFPGQDFDTYIQKSNNLQIWNEEIMPTRRYVILKLDANNIIVKVKVILGEELAMLDKTGTLTQKYQARVVPNNITSELIAKEDTEVLRSLGISNNKIISQSFSPIDFPSSKHLLPIKLIFEKLKSLVGVNFKNMGIDQERNRGATLHRLVCEKLGYKKYQDNGRFPDILNQLLEIKLQTSPTIDLGLVTPDSISPLDMPKINDLTIRHCDVRYAIFYGNNEGDKVKITNFYLSTGELFFSRFPMFQGKVLNKKIQIPLPKDFF